MSFNPDAPDNLTLVQLRGLRREMEAMLERQVRDRELLTRIYGELQATRGEVGDVRREMAGLRNDVLSLEMQMQNRHNEVLAVMRRLDLMGMPSDEGSDGEGPE